MRAYICDKTGPEGIVGFKDVPDPVAKRGQLIVDARAMSLNFPDALQIDGLYQQIPPAPFVVGMEYAGVVSSVGEGVTAFKPGDRVAGMTQGAFAEKVIAAHVSCYHLPENIPFDAGAALTLAGGTAVYGLKYRGALKAGETLAVLGASGGTGRFAIQVGRALGARVIAICSTAEKTMAARNAGAHEIIDLSSTDLSEGLKVLTEGRGVDVLYDPVGGDAFMAACRRINWNGRVLTVGYASGSIPVLPANLALVKGYSLVGVHWAAALFKEEPLARQAVADLFQLYADGGVDLHFDTEYPLADIDKAINQMRQRKVVGKIVVRP